jgi:hypothetical protein
LDTYNAASPCYRLLLLLLAVMQCELLSADVQETMSHHHLLPPV